MTLGAIRFWILGFRCCFCGKWRSGYWHRNCPTILSKPAAEAIHIVTAKVREILQDEPAGQAVHAAYRACDKLDETFSK